MQHNAKHKPQAGIVACQAGMDSFAAAVCLDLCSKNPKPDPLASFLSCQAFVVACQAGMDGFAAAVCLNLCSNTLNPKPLAGILSSQTVIIATATALYSLIPNPEPKPRNCDCHTATPSACVRNVLARTCAS